MRNRKGVLQFLEDGQVRGCFDTSCMCDDSSYVSLSLSLSVYLNAIRFLNIYCSFCVSLSRRLADLSLSFSLIYLPVLSFSYCLQRHPLLLCSPCEGPKTHCMCPDEFPESALVFQPPVLGVSFIGTSHGFDPKGAHQGV